MKQSICEICSHMTEVTSGTGSRFLLCQLSQTDRRFPKYPPQPVIRCEGFIDGKTSRVMNLNLIVLPETIAICRLDADVRALGIAHAVSQARFANYTGRNELNRPR